ncbi:hypothetical protein SLEP1_g18490 [Rubroshorea leprosula]|uniref:DUF3741 domain-containing protein n=1 Tax=Rubroshorea leprosula TaxID=152421 RepID=A0AAV5IXQ0_9ROSI|nr:hypothetical protein SLEP1_g18490 [Rubroshorea leprosula]
MYRSFVTCDDPNGVVECGMIRRSRSRPGKMEPKIERGKEMKKSSACKVEKGDIVSKGSSAECHKPSSSQLLEVSRGAQKLNQVIDIWSKETKNVGNSKDIAKDLLKGALDLQESLHMLGKLQEASQYKSRLKEKEKSDRLRMSEVMDRVNSSSFRFREQNYQMGFQNPRLSADGSSRDSIEELKKVIRESLARQNLLPDGKTEKNAYLSGRYMESALDLPSTSSSQTSMVHTSNFSSTDSPMSSAASEKKAKGPTLVAKLMGLEEFPSKQLQTTTKLLDREKIFNQQRPAFDMDMPRARKPPFLVQKEDSERRTLQEILETIHLKGLLKSKSSKEHNPPYLHSHDPFSRQRLLNDGVPIVLIKPLRDPWSQVKKPSMPVFGEERAVNKETVLKKKKANEEPPSITIDCKQRGLNYDRMSDNVVAEETTMKRVSHDGVGDRKKTKIRSEKQEVETKQKLLSRMKNAGALTQQPEKKDAIEKKPVKVQKLATASRKPVEKEIVKAKNLTRYQDEAKGTPTKFYNLRNSTKNQSSQKQSTASNSISTSRKRAKVHGTREQKKSPVKKETPVSKPTAAKVIIENLGHEAYGKRLTSENDSALVEDQKSMEGTESSENQLGGHCNNDRSSVSGIIPGTGEFQRDSKCSEEVDDRLSPHEESKSFRTGNTLKALLLSNPEFQNHAEELFDLNVNAPTTFQLHRTIDSIDSQVRLSLDCANEITRRRGSLDSQMIHPLSPNLVRFMRIHISLDQLLDQVCYEVEILRSYSELAGKNNPTDTLREMLERDIKHKELSTGIWDLGWSNVFSMDDIGAIVNDIETWLITALVEEIFS